MPLTPFHLGPGAVFKAIGGARFSFMIFGGSQILMDIEPLIHIMRGDAVLHGPSHTLAGATVIGIVAAISGRPISSRLLLRSGIVEHSITRSVSWVSAFVGTFSHILLDAFMHRDMRPFWPVTPANPLLGAIPLSALYLICLACGLVGGLAIMFSIFRRS